MPTIVLEAAESYTVVRGSNDSWIVFKTPESFTNDCIDDFQTCDGLYGVYNILTRLHAQQTAVPDVIERNTRERVQPTLAEPAPIRVSTWAEVTPNIVPEVACDISQTFINDYSYVPTAVASGRYGGVASEPVCCEPTGQIQGSFSAAREGMGAYNLRYAEANGEAR